LCIEWGKYKETEIQFAQDPQEEIPPGKKMWQRGKIIL